MLFEDLDKLSDKKIIQTELRGGIKRNVFYSEKNGVAWLENIQKEEKFLDIYSKEYRETFYNENKRKISRNHGNMLKVQNRRIQFIKPLMREEDSLLEIGSSSGYFLESLQGIKKKVGIELNSEEVNYGKSLGIDIREGGLECLDKNEKYNHVCAFQVLEHQLDPEGFIMDLVKLTKKGGFIHIEVPTLDNPLISYYQIEEFRNFWFQEPHIYYFSKKFIGILAQRLNLEIVQKNLLQTTSFYNHVNWLITKQPMKNRVQCESNTLFFEKTDTFKSEDDNHDLNLSKAKMDQLFIDFNQQYQKILENYKFGDVLFFTLKVN